MSKLGPKLETRRTSDLILEKEDILGDLQDFSAVTLVNDLLMSEVTRDAIQQLFQAIAVNKKTGGTGTDAVAQHSQEKGKQIIDQARSREKWIKTICANENDEKTKAARLALLKVVIFLKCAQGTEEAEDFIDCILSIGNVGETKSAKMISIALQDPQTADSLQGLVLALKEPTAEELNKALDDLVDVFEQHQGCAQAAADVANQMESLNDGTSFINEILKRFEEQFQKDNTDFIKLASKDPLNFAQQLIQYVLWPVICDRLACIEVPDIEENKSKDTYSMRNIFILVTDMPKVIKLDVKSTIEMEIDGKDMRNGGSQMYATLSANSIAAKSSIISFEFDKRSFPAISDAGDLDVKILPPGFDISVQVIVYQPPHVPGQEVPATFQGGQVKCDMKNFNITFHENVKNEKILNIVGRWFNPVLREQIAKSVSGHLKKLISDGFSVLTRLLHAQQRLMSKVKEREKELKTEAAEFKRLSQSQ